MFCALSFACSTAGSSVPGGRPRPCVRLVPNMRIFGALACTGPHRAAERPNTRTILKRLIRLNRVAFMPYRLARPPGKERLNAVDAEVAQRTQTASARFARHVVLRPLCILRELCTETGRF